MNVIEKYHNDMVSLEDAIRHYNKGGDVEELVLSAKTDGGRKMALYIMSEIGRPAEAFWREVLPYVTDEDYSVAYTALDLVHAYASVSDYREVLHVLTRVNLRQPALFAKMFSIFLAKEADLFPNMLNHAIEQDHELTYITGLALFCSEEHVAKHALKRLLLTENLVLKLFACCIVAKTRSKDKEMVTMMPSMVKEDLRLFKRLY